MWELWLNERVRKENIASAYDDLYLVKQELWISESHTNKLPLFVQKLSYDAPISIDCGIPQLIDACLNPSEIEEIIDSLWLDLPRLVLDTYETNPHHISALLSFLQMSASLKFKQQWS